LARRVPSAGGIRPGAAAFWGVFPDLFSFTPFFVWFAIGRLTGTVSPDVLPSHERLEPFAPDRHPLFDFTQNLYQLSHSLVVWAAVLLVVWLVLSRVLKKQSAARLVGWEMGAWALHILMDIPTHTYRFFPTPFLWPLSEWKFDGISWGQPWFMAVNYGVLLALFAYIRRRDRAASQP
jgi:membrane-bound metal-dependent hydrolase YbcI (DUF457 family)